MTTLRFCAPLLFAAALLAPGVARAETFAHDEWTQVLERFVDARGDVDYQGLAKERARLDRYVARIGTVGPQSQPRLFPDRRHQLAYYLNAYNALVFAGVLARGPETDTVWTGGLIPGENGIAFFSGMDVRVDGEETNLKSLEDDVIRAGFQDPRIHAALNCASRSCPRLPREAFTGERLEEQLDAAMREFVGERRNVEIDVRARAVTLSKIFDWFADDFLAYERRQGNPRPSVVDYVNRYRPANARVPRDYEVEFADYDKGINAQ